MNAPCIHHETGERLVFHKRQQQQQRAKLEESVTELTLDETDFHCDDELVSDNGGSNDHDCAGAAAVCFSPLLARFVADLFSRTSSRRSNAFVPSRFDDDGDDDDEIFIKCSSTSTTTTTLLDDETTTAQEEDGNETSSATTVSCSDGEGDEPEGRYATDVLVELHSEPVKPTYQLADFRRHKILGEGQFGQVWLVSTQQQEEEENDNVVVHHRPYALKVLSKYELIEDGEVQQILSETSILSQLHHPFIVRLEATFQDESLVYLLQEFCQGGELFSLLCDSHHHDGDDGGQGGGLPESQAAFYAACIADALSYLHRPPHRIVYRDLKPENCMLDSEGYPKLIDMGYAKVLTPANNFQTRTFCGTPRYLAPECIDRGSSTGGGYYSFGADHWALGALVYEMLAGFHPFWWDGLDEATLLANICDGRCDALPAAAAPATAVDLVARLLVTDPAARLGGSDGEDEILQHAWLRGHFGADREALRRRRVAAPWIPALGGGGGALDTSCFDDWEDELQDRTKQDYPRLTRAQAALFAPLGGAA